jgi:hypothetical protein
MVHAPNDRRCLVRRAVVHEYKLEIDALLRENAFDSLPNMNRFVLRSDDNRYVGQELLLARRSRDIPADAQPQPN